MAPKTNDIALEFSDPNEKDERFAQGVIAQYCICPSRTRKTTFSLYTKIVRVQNLPERDHVHHAAYGEFSEAVAAAEAKEAAFRQALSEIYKFNV